MSDFKPLQGIKVVEWSTFIAAPSCARTLADWGADVIKVETPEGDYWRIYGPKMDVPASDDENPLFDIANANKRSITLNLRTPEGKEILEKLISQSDIMITNTRERVLKKLGFDYEAVSARHPGLIYATVTGYGDVGPEASRPGYDAVTYWAHGGFLADMTPAGQGTTPVNIPAAMADIATGSMLFGAIMAALNAKLRTGRGDKVSVSLYGAAVWTMGMMNAAVQPQYGYYYPRAREVAKPASTFYKCKDGEWIAICAAQYDRDFPRLCHALGADDAASDPRYATYDDYVREENRVPLLHRFEEIFLTKTSVEWDALLEELDIVHDILCHYKDVYKSEQVRVNHFMEEVTYRNGNKAWLARPCFISKNLGVPEYNLAPIMGEHSAEILGELGYTPEQIGEMHSKEAFYGPEHKALQR